MKYPLPDDYTCRLLTPNDWQEMKDLRLEALQKAAGLFGDSYAVYVELPDQEWQKILETRVYFGVFHHNIMVGMAALIENRDNKDEVFLSAAYVTPAHRGKKLTNVLFEHCIGYTHNSSYNLIWCSTKQGNDAVISLCNTFGFTFSHAHPKHWPDDSHADVLYFKMAI